MKPVSANTDNSPQPLLRSLCVTNSIIGGNVGPQALLLQEPHKEPGHVRVIVHHQHAERDLLGVRSVRGGEVTHRQS